MWYSTTAGSRPTPPSSAELSSRKEHGLRLRLAAAVLVVLALLATAMPSGAVVGQPSPARAGVVRGRTWLLRNSLSGGPAEVTFDFGLAGDRKVMGDWNGDGTRTPGVFRDGTWYLRDRNGAGGRYVSFAFGAAGDRPVVGDWNGDGIETVGVFRAGGYWYLRNSNRAGLSEIRPRLGIVAGDLPVVGDWNGDGTDTIGIFRAGGYWYLRDSNTAATIDHTARYGAQPGDVPVVGDWNGDGLDTIGIFRAGAWHLRNTISGGSPDRLFYYGRQPGDVPAVWKQVQTTVPASLQGSEWSRLPTTRKVVALTFDAGANADGIPKIMAALQSNGVAGTFFLTGQWAERFPQQTVQIGTYYPIANHTWSHPHLPTLTDDQVRDQITRASDQFRAATAQDDRPLFRFPFGDRDARTIGLANSLGYGSIRWTVDTLGWQGTSGGQTVQSVVDRVLGTLQPGQIVLMHVGSHPTDGSTLDADALPILISELRARGYGFTTVRQYT
jgi:peptidoglycan/xylan/chitin deacetylase (PgdA/CDA1 family)